MRDLALDLMVEFTPGDGAMAHVPDLPGLSFRPAGAADAGAAAWGAAALAGAPAAARAHLAWLRARHGPLPPEDVMQAVGAMRFRLAEVQEGAPLWSSGNAAALFVRDHDVLDDASVDAHLRVAELALVEIRSLVATVARKRLAWRPAAGRRSLAETLEHLGNVAWWYAARLDDDRPESPELADEYPGDRPLRLLADARAFLLAVPPDRRTTVVVPRRYPTRDRGEPWTHAKACRREAEHALEHLPGVRRDAAAARAAVAADGGS